MRAPGHRRLRGLLLLGLLVAATALLSPGTAAASHAPPGTPLWAFDAFTERILRYDIGSDTLVTSCLPPGVVGARGLAYDLVTANLWYTFVAPGDGLIHLTTPPPVCTPVTAIPFGDGPGGTVQDDVGALDADPDDGHLWAAGYAPVAGNQVLYKVNRTTGAVITSCTVPPVTGGFNDTLAVVRLPNLPGSGKYLLTDAGEFFVHFLEAVDVATCTGGGPGTIVATFATPGGPTGIDMEGGPLIASARQPPNPTGPRTIDSWGPPPFGTLLASLLVGPSRALEDVTLRAEVELDHFKCYEAFPGSPLNVPVTLADQFEVGSAVVHRLDRLCNPVDKNGGGIAHQAHLTCWPIRSPGSPPFAPRKVSVTNQFGTRKLTVVERERLCAPASKGGLGTDPGPPPALLDHFKCYRVTGPPALKLVTLADQFELELAMAMWPRRLCNPVEKTHGGVVTPIQRPADHLVCYGLRSFIPFQPRFVVAQDQFAASLVRATARESLCLPSSKH